MIQMFWSPIIISLRARSEFQEATVKYFGKFVIDFETQLFRSADTRVGYRSIFINKNLSIKHFVFMLMSKLLNC